MRGEFVAVRVTPSHAWYRGEQHDECWLLCERSVGAEKAAKFYLSNLPRRTALKRLVDLARSRWAIEQSYEHLKDELALDHFEGRVRVRYFSIPADARKPDKAVLGRYTATRCNTDNLEQDCEF